MMRVRFLGCMPEKGYSGGRLLAITLAESLAMIGVNVDFIVNNRSVMFNEFASFSKVTYQIACFDNLSAYVDASIDHVVIVPNLGSVFYHGEWARHAIECHAKLILLNFETPNWFNLYSPVKRDPKRWLGWDIVSEYADMILSISAEGNIYARRHYVRVKQSCKFDYCYTAINSVAADSAREGPREKKIIMITRVDAHKGLDALLALADSSLKGYELKVFLGTGSMPRLREQKLKMSFARVGMHFGVFPAISGVDKFNLLKSASILYFPTQFEGFGIPPLEAAYCRLPCACSDLPVLREFGREALTYANRGDRRALLKAVHIALAEPNRITSEYDRIVEIAAMSRCGERLCKKLESIL